MDQEPGEGMLHEDEHCTCRVQRGRIVVSPRRSFSSWWDATTSERDALQRAIGAGRNYLIAKRPDLPVHITWRETGATSPPDTRLQIEVSSESSSEPPILDDAPHRRGLIRGETDPLLDHLAHCLPRARRVDIAVAFVLDRGVRLLRPYLQDLLARGDGLRLITGDYFGVTEPDGLESLLDLDGPRELCVFESGGMSFHPKSYVFHLHDGEGVAFVGSSNLSRVALGNGVEWNYRVVRSRDGSGFASVCDGFERLLQHPKTRPLTHEWVHAYRRTRLPDAPQRQGIAPEAEAPPAPHGIQERALTALRETRAEGNMAGLVVLATGLGKTWLSAFDSRDFARVLFVAHREEILAQARQTFRRVRPDANLGLYTGKEKAPDADVLFASIQTLGRARHLRDFAADRFDYIVVDEFHHAAARTYRLLIEHFTPRFLLGLTATPERTDGADLLALCGNSVVFRCDLVEGVTSGLLSPFAYYGVPDDVDYEQIPWRSSRFDEEALTNELATQQRADNALAQHGKYGGRRTLGFCASQRHADFMADHFNRHGRRAVAVHSGQGSAPRANSLEALRRGDLDIVFSVDMLNEGVDVPDVDTVMMLRPTESRTLWLQQFGRGLRKAAGKDHLRVIDYIGNHRTFLEKARALLGSLFDVDEGHEALRMALLRLGRGTAELPPGCSVTYELETIEILEQLLRPTAAQDLLRAGYLEFRERHGRRPTAAELHGSGVLSRKALKTAASSWFGYVDLMEDLDAASRNALAAHGDFLRELEQARMERSYKMLLLQAMLELEALPGSTGVDELAERLQRIAQRSPQLRQELATTLDDGQGLVNMVRQNPIRAWTGTKRGRGSAFFVLDGERFGTRFEVADDSRPALTELVRELVEWRLAEYLDHTTGRTFECRVTRNSSGHPILMLPDRARHSGLPDGEVTVVAEGEEFAARFAKIAVNVMRRDGDQTSANALPELLRYWFGDSAGQPGTRNVVRFTAGRDRYDLTPVARRSEQLTVRDPRGLALDAHFVVESMGDRAAVIYSSRGGAKGSAAERNTDYTPGLEVLLQRARGLGLVLTDALVDSKPARQQAREQRRLHFEEADLPLDLTTIADTQQVRRWIAQAQRRLGGNETRQLRLIFKPREPGNLEALARQLSAGN